jgi:hypothetical protein
MIGHGGERSSLVDPSGLGSIPVPRDKPTLQTSGLEAGEDFDLAKPGAEDVVLAGLSLELRVQPPRAAIRPDFEGGVNRPDPRAPAQGRDVAGGASSGMLE